MTVPLPEILAGWAPQAVALVAGAALLGFGRRLFWLAVGLVGFAFGYALAGRALRLDSAVLELLAAVAAGVLGALLAVFVQRVAVALAGFAVAGYTAYWLLEPGALGDPGAWRWFVVLGVAVAGALLGRAVFELAVVLLTSLVGASLVVQALPGFPDRSGLLFAALAGLGVVVQLLLLGRADRSAPRGGTR